MMIMEETVSLKLREVTPRMLRSQIVYYVDSPLH